MHTTLCNSPGRQIGRMDLQLSSAAPLSETASADLDLELWLCVLNVIQNIAVNHK